MSKHLLLNAALAAAIALGASAAFADEDPPGRVGRLSYMEGTVSFHTADQGQWSPATLNYPIVAGESFWTEPQSRLELQVGTTEIRLDQTTELDIVALDDRSTRLWLGEGAMNLHLATLPPGGVQVLTPRSEIHLVEPGSYHIDAFRSDADGSPDQLRVTTLEGRAEVSGPRSRIEVLPGESAVIAGDPIAVTLTEGGATPLDDWALQRERREMARYAARYVSPEATGYQDLDDYGRWTSSPAYGAVWYPTAVPADWAPYRYGHWAWVAPWGWTWVDDAPWGFAPFHYGRWVEVDGRWGWCPGEVVARPVYAPALVAFIGGAGFGVTISTGPAMPAVGWVPLAPAEVYHPYYRTSVTYVRNVNVTSVNRTEINNITNVTVVNNTTVVNNYRNHQAATVVPTAAFAGAAPVHKAVVAVPRQELAQARVAPSVEHLQPSQAARVGAVVPAAATAVVPHPNAPASVAKTPVTPAAIPAVKNEPALPVAPGPRSRDQRETRLPPPGPPATQTHRDDTPPGRPAMTAPGPGNQPPPRDMAAPHPPGPPATQTHRDETPPGRPAMTAPGPGSQPPHRDMAMPQPPPGPPGNRPAATTVPPPQRPVPQPQPSATMATPPRPPAPQPAAMATPPKPPPMPVERPAQQTRLAPTPQGWVRTPAPPAQQHAPAGQPAPAHSPPPANDKDKKDEHKPGG